MPRHAPLKTRNLAKIKRRLPPAPEFAGLLGFSELPHHVATELADWIAIAKTTTSAVTGLTRQARVAELKRWEKKLRRELQSGIRNARLRELIANPQIGLDTETFLHLAPLAPTAPSDQLLAAVETRRLAIERLPRISPQREARASAGGVAVWFFLLFATVNVRDKEGAWWRFVLAFLAAAGFPTTKLHQHPEDLRPLLDKFRVEQSGLTTVVRANPSLLKMAADAAG